MIACRTREKLSSSKNLILAKILKFANYTNILGTSLSYLQNYL